MAEYCVYLRKSRADRDAEMRGEEETLARHKRLLTELANKMGMNISRFYSEVVSGETIADRPVMQQLLSDVESGLWDGVIVIEVERLARGNTKDQGIVADAFKYSNTKIITLTKTYDPENEFDEEYFEFGLFMSRREYKTINRRLQRGRIASVKEGRFIGSTAPYGYNKVKIPHDKGYTLEINPDAAPVVQMIYEWYCNGIVQPDGTQMRLGADAIAAKLDSLGIRPAINDNWSRATIRDILSNITYTGVVSFGRRKEVKSSVNGNVIKMRKTNDDYTSALGKHPAIISTELFQKAQRIKGQNRKNTVPSTNVLQNPFSGIIYCKKCGALMTRLAPNSRNKYATLKCPNRYCDNVSSPLFLIETEVLSFLRNWLNSYDVDSASSKQKNPINSEIKTKEENARKIDSDIQALHSQLERAYNMLEQGVYSIDIFKQRQDSLNNNIEALEKSRMNLEAELKRYHSLMETEEQYAPKVRHLLDTYNTNTVSINNEILKEVIEKVQYEKNERNTRGNLENANFELSIFPKIPI